MEKVELKIIFEDNQILVLDKPSGVAVTRAETVKSATVQDWLVQYFNLGANLGIGGRAGIVHRLDRQTSGVILIAKTVKSFEFLQKQFAKRQVGKNYLALVHGIPDPNSFTVDLPIARYKFGKFGVRGLGRKAVTKFHVLKKFEFGKTFEQLLQNFPKKLTGYFAKYAKFYTLCEAAPLTGRTHQIRVHLKSVNSPIVADSLYCPSKLLKFDANFCPRLFLHAARITFTHPATLKPVTFEAKLPNDLKLALQYLKEIKN